jgi:hypothetical protein
MPSRDYVAELKKQIVRDLNYLSHLIGRFHSMIHKGVKPEEGHLTKLDSLPSLYWAAALSQTLSDNTCKFRDSMKSNEVPEDKCWPEPDPIEDKKVDVSNLWKTIQMTVSMELATFRNMTRQYPNFPKYKWPRKRLSFIHDLLNEILLNTNAFIVAEKTYLAPHPVHLKPPPPPPEDLLPIGSTERKELIRFEHGLRRYIEVHMQIATFIPAHLRKPPAKKFRRLGLGRR